MYIYHILTCQSPVTDADKWGVQCHSLMTDMAFNCPPFYVTISFHNAYILSYHYNTIIIISNIFRFLFYLFLYFVCVCYYTKIYISSIMYRLKTAILFDRYQFIGTKYLVKTLNCNAEGLEFSVRYLLVIVTFVDDALFHYI